MLEDGTDKLSRDIGTELPPRAAEFPTRAQISSISERKPKITHCTGLVHITNMIKRVSSNTSYFIVCGATCFGPYMTIIRPSYQSGQ